MSNLLIISCNWYVNTTDCCRLMVNNSINNKIDNRMLYNPVNCFLRIFISKRSTLKSEQLTVKYKFSVPNL